MVTPEAVVDMPGRVCQLIADYARPSDTVWIVDTRYVRPYLFNSEADADKFRAAACEADDGPSVLGVSMEQSIITDPIKAAMEDFGSFEVHCYGPPDADGRFGEMNDEATQHFPLNKKANAEAAFTAAKQDPKWRRVVLMKYGATETVWAADSAM